MDNFEKLALFSFFILSFVFFFVVLSSPTIHASPPTELRGVVSFSDLITKIRGPFPVNTCGDLYVPNRIYSLKRDLIHSSGGNCINIVAPNITFDCNGHSINIVGSTSATGIFSGVEKTVLLNCNIVFDSPSSIKGISFVSSNYSRIVNSSILNNYASSETNDNGIYIKLSDFIHLSKLEIKNVNGPGIVIYDSSKGYYSNIVSDNNFNGVKIQGNSTYNEFTNINTTRNGDGFFIGNEGYFGAKGSPSYNLFSDCITSFNDDKGITFQLSGIGNTLVRFSADSNGGSSIRVNGAKDLTLQDSTFSKAGSSEFLSSTNTNSGIRFINVNFASTGTFNDISYVNGAANMTYFTDTTVSKYQIDQMGTFVFERTGKGSIFFYNGIKGTGTRLTQDIFVKQNLATISATENVFLDAPSEITFYNMPGNFTNPAIYRNGSICTDCNNLTSLNVPTVVFIAPGAGSYYIAEN